MFSTAPRTTGQATLITGFFGSGKTWSLTNQLLKDAKIYDSGMLHHGEASVGSGSLLALSGNADCRSLQQRIDLDRPLGCTRCEALTFPSLVRTIVEDFGPTVGSYTPDYGMVLTRSELSVLLHRNLDKLPLGKYRPLHDPSNAVQPLLTLFSSLAHCGVSPEEYLRYVETLEMELLQKPAEPRGGRVADDQVTEESGASTTGSAVMRKRRRAEEEGWRSHVAGERDKANSYDAFVKLKRQEGVVDFSDKLLLARRVLKESASAKAALSLRLSHIYVDDLQDYTPAMMDVLVGLAAPGVGITATVDPFLTAASRYSLGNVLGPEYTPVARFKAAFPGAVEVRLACNHRNTDAIRVAMKALEPRDTPIGVRKESNKRETAVAHVAGDTVPVADLHTPPPAALGVGEVSSAAPDEARARAPSVTTSESRVPIAGGSKLTCLTFKTEEDELKALGTRVKRLIDGGVNPGDIGVAAVGGRGNVDALSAALRAAGVQVEGHERMSAVFDYETPRMLMSFLRCLLHPSESAPLLHLVMTCPTYALQDGELTAALEGHLLRHVPLRSFLQESQMGDERNTHQRGRGVDGVSANARDVAGRLLSDLSRFSKASKRKGVRQVMHDFLRYTGQLKKLEEPTTTMEEQDGRAVAELFNLTVKAEKQVGGDKVAMIEPVLRLFRCHGARFHDPVHDDIPTDDESETREGSSHFASGDAVRIFSLIKDREYGEHSSFDTVFIPFCTRARLPGILRTAALPVPGPFRGAPEPRDSARLRMEANNARTAHENRSRARLYAALGSARREVCLSVSASIRGVNTHLNPSPFLHDILGAGAPREWKTMVKPSMEKTGDGVGRSAGVVDEGGEDVDAAPEAVWEGRQGSGDAGIDTSEPPPQESPPQPPVSPLRLSFSSISSFSTCPHSYYLEYVLNVSPSPNPRMVYGRVMHEGVAAVLRGVVNGGSGPPPSLEAIVEDFDLHFDGCAFESATQARTLRAAGVAGLESFLSRIMSDVGGDGRDDLEASPKDSLQPQQLLVEKKFMVKVPEANVVLSGIFDRVDFAPPSSAGTGEGCRPPSLSITDYKSNVGSKDPKRMVRNNLQLRIYALAAERLFRVFPTELAIESIEDGRRGAAVPSPADTDIALRVICDTAAAVRAEKFDATPSFQTCSFCGFKHMCQHSVIRNTAL